MRMQDYPLEPSYAARVIRSERLTEEVADDEVRELVLEIDRDDFKPEVGQCIGVVVAGAQEFGARSHHRLYSVADAPRQGDSGKPEVTIVVRRCTYVDDYSGEEYPGVCSNYLCDRQEGDLVDITGPFGIPFDVPEDRSANLLLVGMGTGIAPFRGLVRHIYEDESDWHGKVWLLYGAQSGLELLYMNDKRDDFAKYYDEETFQAFKALSPRPEWADPIAWDYAIESRAEEIWYMLDDEHTYVYVAGLHVIRDSLDEMFARLAGSPEVWAERKESLSAEGRWVELLY